MPVSPALIEHLRKTRREIKTWRCRIFGCEPDWRFAHVAGHRHLCRRCGFNLALLPMIGEAEWPDF